MDLQPVNQDQQEDIQQGQFSIAGIAPVKRYGAVDQSQIIGTYRGEKTYNRSGKQISQLITFRGKSQLALEKARQKYLQNAQAWVSLDPKAQVGVSGVVSSRMMKAFQPLVQSFADRYTFKVSSNGTAFNTGKSTRQQIYGQYKQNATRETMNDVAVLNLFQAFNYLARAEQLRINNPDDVDSNRRSMDLQYKKQQQIQAIIRQLQLNTVRDLTKDNVAQQINNLDDQQTLQLRALAQQGITTKQGFQDAVSAAGRLYGYNNARAFF